MKKGFSRFIQNEPVQSKHQEQRPDWSDKSSPIQEERASVVEPDSKVDETEIPEELAESEYSESTEESPPLDANQPDSLTTIESKIDEITAEVKELTELRQDLSKFMMTGDVIDAINRSLTRATTETRETTEKQLLKDFAGCNETYLKMIGEMRAAYSESSEVLQVLDYMEAFSYEIENMLMRWNVMPFENKTAITGEIRVVKTEPTDAREKDMEIKTSVSRGYRYGEYVLLPQSAIVYKYVPSNSTDSETPIESRQPETDKDESEKE